jgi:hypothetical protein
MGRDAFVKSLQTPPTVSPAFVRIPRAGQVDPFSGLRRTQFFELIKSGKVKSHLLKNHPGAKRGVRLIDAVSLVEAIKSQAA